MSVDEKSARSTCSATRSSDFDAETSAPCGNRRRRAPPESVTVRSLSFLGANRQRIASSRSSFFRHRIVDLKVGRSRHFIRQKCRFSPPHGEAARHSRLPFSGGPGSSAWRKSPNIQALPEGATTVADRGFNAAGSQRTSRCSTVGRLHDWHQAKRCAVGSSLPNPKRCAVGKSEAMRCRLASRYAGDPRPIAGRYTPRGRT